MKYTSNESSMHTHKHTLTHTQRLRTASSLWYNQIIMVGLGVQFIESKMAKKEMGMYYLLSQSVDLGLYLWKEKCMKMCRILYISLLWKFKVCCSVRMGWDLWDVKLTQLNQTYIEPAACLSFTKFGTIFSSEQSLKISRSPVIYPHTKRWSKTLDVVQRMVGELPVKDPNHLFQNVSEEMWIWMDFACLPGKRKTTPETKIQKKDFITCLWTRCWISPNSNIT